MKTVYKEDKQSAHLGEPLQNALLYILRCVFATRSKLLQLLLVPAVDAPLSGQSLGSILEFREAAGALKEAESDVRLGGVDVKKEKDLAASLNVTIIPSLQLFLSGDKNNPVYCPGNVEICALTTFCPYLLTLVPFQTQIQG